MSYFECKRFRKINPPIAKDKDTSISAEQANTAGNGYNATYTLPANPIVKSEHTD